jgi:hypothetical protein
MRAQGLSGPGPRRAHDPVGSRTLARHSSDRGPCDSDLGRARPGRLWLGPRPLDRGRTRPPSHDRKGDPVPQEAARQALDAVKKKPPPAPSSGAVKMRPVSPGSRRAAPPWGVKGHRPMVGTLHGHAGVDVFAALTLGTGQWTTRLVARLQKAKKPGPSKPRYGQEGLARHRRDSARTSPAAPSPPWYG